MVAQSLWISAISLALDTWHDMNRREDMDQSESVVVGSPEGRAKELPTMTLALAMDGTTEVNHQSLHLEIDGQHV